MAVAWETLVIVGWVLLLETISTTDAMEESELPYSVGDRGRTNRSCRRWVSTARCSAYPATWSRSASRPGDRTD